MKGFSTRVATVVAVLLLGGASLIPPLAAQDSSDWLRVNVVNVVPERWEDYIELQLNEVNPALQEAGVPWRSAWRTAEFGTSYEMQFVTPIGDLAGHGPRQVPATRGPVAQVHGVSSELRLTVSP